jgi:hypothetical protein
MVMAALMALKSMNDVLDIMLLWLFGFDERVRNQKLKPPPGAILLL